MTLTMQPISRADLLAIPAKRRWDAICSYVDHNVTQNVRQAATLGKTCYMFVVPPKHKSMASTYPPPYEVTPDDIVEGLRAKFPDCKIDFAEEIVETRPGVREIRSGIMIDWS
jgi:hypothetical protein